jgi:hypothetical protein
VNSYFLKGSDFGLFGKWNFADWIQLANTSVTNYYSSFIKATILWTQSVIEVLQIALNQDLNLKVYLKLIQSLYPELLKVAATDIDRQL